MKRLSALEEGLTRPTEAIAFATDGYESTFSYLLGLKKLNRQGQLSVYERTTQMDVGLVILPRKKRTCFWNLTAMMSVVKLWSYTKQVVYKFNIHALFAIAISSFSVDM